MTEEKDSEVRRHFYQQADGGIRDLAKLIIKLIMGLLQILSFSDDTTVMGKGNGTVL